MRLHHVQGPERASRFQDYSFHPDVDEAWIQALLAWENQVGDEHLALVERVRSGVRSGMLERGVLLEGERLIAPFDGLVMEALAR